MTQRPHSGRAVAVPSGRLSRLARLGSMTAGVAGNMALNGVAQLSQGKRPSTRALLLTPANMHRITDQLAQMRGAAMKVGQLLSMDTGEILLPELTEILARLRADAHFMPPAQLKKALNRNWPAGWLQQVERFDVHPIAAASIGQVHRAWLKDGRLLAIKVQYPGVANSIDNDVSNVGALIRMTGLIPKRFELKPYLEEARSQLHEETDYLKEGAHLIRFAALLRDDTRFALPELHSDWTTSEVLAMSFESGAPIETILDTPQDLRDQVAHDLFDLFLSEIFDFGVIQSDPNFANYRYNADTGRIVLLDFGATRDIDMNVVDQYRRLVVSGLAGDDDGLHRMALEIGYVAPETGAEHRSRLLHLTRMVFDACREYPMFDFATTDLARRMHDEGMALAKTGFVPPPVPMDVLFIQRKLAGMFLLARRLGARVPVRRLLETHLH